MSDQWSGNGHPDTGALSRLADDGTEGVRETVRDHVRGCPECRREVEGIRRVLQAARALPSGIPLARDLWPVVEARVRELRTSPRFGSRSGGGELREAAPWLAAAAAVLIAVTAGATLWLSGSGEAPRFADSGADPMGAPAAEAESDAGPGSGPVPGATAMPASLEGVRSGYAPMVSRLTELVEQRRDRLPPEIRQTLERNLMIIDAAIAEAEAALAERPTSPTLVRALDRTYERKLDLLERSARLAVQM